MNTGLLFHIRPTDARGKVQTFCGLPLVEVYEGRLDEHATTEANIRDRPLWVPGDSVCIQCVRGCIHDKFVERKP